MDNLQLPPIMATESNSTSLRASPILKQDFSLYVKWQLKRVPGSEMRLIKDAFEYYRFIKHRDAVINHDSSSSSTSPLTSPPASPLSWKTHIASECGHTYLPSDPVIAESCPVCEATAHLAFLRAITVAWDKAGGPTLQPGQHRKGESYYEVRAG
jgi:hypothetical protein